jgi:tryptophan 2,3-dioxygenase
VSAGDDDRGGREGARRPSLGSHVDVAGEGVHWDLGESLSYGEYLHLDEVLGAQQPLSGQHDEMLFIVMHQASELWMKLCIHELRAAIALVRRDELDPAFKMLARVSRVQMQLAQSWDVLSTMTPADYSAFRASLGRSSGFQSYQYRTLEYLIGNRNAAMIEVHRRSPAVYAELRAALESPSLYDECVRLLARRGFAIPAGHLERDFSLPYVESEQVREAWLAVYLDVDRHWDLYELAEKLVDLDQRFQLWRFAHLKTVERIIGYKRGTGGTSGVAYLAKALDLRFFPELWSVRTAI